MNSLIAMKTHVKYESPIYMYFDVQLIRLFTNFMTMRPSVTSIELQVVLMEHLQWVWLASRERLPYRTHGSVLFGTCLCSYCWDQFSRTCRVLSRLFTLINPQFCSVSKVMANDKVLKTILQHHQGHKKWSSKIWSLISSYDVSVSEEKLIMHRPIRV